MHSNLNNDGLFEQVMNTPLMTIGKQGSKYTCMPTVEFDFDENILAAICIVIADCMIDNVPEAEQCAFEEEFLKRFNFGFKRRADFTTKEQPQ